MNHQHLPLFTNVERLFNIFSVLSILLLSVVVFVYQIILKQLPCPLCLLQRFGFLAIAFGFLLNLRYGLRSSHYSIILLSAIFANFVALREMNLLMNTETMATVLFGLHLETWSFIVTVIIIIATALILGIKRSDQELHSVLSYWKSITSSLFGVLAVIIFANMISVFLQCGFSPCPDKPTTYKLLSTVIERFEHRYL